MLWTNTIFNEPKSCNICRLTYVVPIYLCKQNIKPVLVNTPQQSIQSCTPLVNKQFTPGFHGDLMTG